MSDKPVGQIMICENYGDCSVKCTAGCRAVIKAGTSAFKKCDHVHRMVRFHPPMERKTQVERIIAHGIAVSFSEEANKFAARIQEMEKDKARLDWLLENCVISYPGRVQTLTNAVLNRTEIDRMISAAKPVV